LHSDVGLAIITRITGESMEKREERKREEARERG
jgi:hypothetical protein